MAKRARIFVAGCFIVTACLGAWLYATRLLESKADQICAGIREGTLNDLDLGVHTRSALTTLGVGQVDCFLESSPYQEGAFEKGIVVAVGGRPRIGLRATVSFLTFRPLRFGPRVAIRGYWSFHDADREAERREP